MDFVNQTYQNACRFSDNEHEIVPSLLQRISRGEENISMQVNFVPSERWRNLGILPPLQQFVPMIFPIDYAISLELCIKHEQNYFIQKELISLANGEAVSIDTLVAKLLPFLDLNGIIRIKGRKG